MTLLQCLHLELNGLNGNDGRFVEWLTSVPSPDGPNGFALPQPPPPVTFDHLQEITLHHIYGVHVQAMVSLPRKFAPTLRELRLYSIELKTSLPGSGSTPRALGSLWTAFLKSLQAELGDKLQSLLLSNVMKMPYHFLDHFVSFATEQGRYGLCACSGPVMKHAVEAMIHYIEGDSSWTPLTREGTWKLERSRDGIK